jgi:hypothetical protein
MVLRAVIAFYTSNLKAINIFDISFASTETGHDITNLYYDITYFKINFYNTYRVEYHVRVDIFLDVLT